MEDDYSSMKYKLLEDQYKAVKIRNEELESRILDIIEKSESDKLSLCRELDKMAQELEIIKGAKVAHSTDILKKSDSSADMTAPEDPLIDRSKPFPRANSIGSQPLALPKTPKGKTVKFEFNDIPILSKREGMIYGFSWTRENTVKAL